MNQNIFQEFQEKKARLIEIAAQAKVNGWIDEAREKQIVDKINNDTLTIGVIGQMKCGKSTFLNAFVFGDTVLPAATTPMTAALSIITYGPDKKIEVEFYTPDEWTEQKMQASRNLDDVRGNEIEESKIKAAKELVNKAGNIPGDINSYLGKTYEDSFNNLIKYVGADGPFVSITKSVKLYYPHEYLKGVEIVDTPGFNDPIVSREERTKEFLHNADVVLLMLYAGRAFDTTDRTILFKNVRECGIGKILIGVNKYDIPYGNGETEQCIISTVKSQIEQACKSSGDETMVTLVREQDPILLSAEMALMAQLPMNRVNKEFETSWERACTNFEISSQAQMEEKSHIEDLRNAVKNVIQRDKIEILLIKPYNAIRGAALSKKEELETEFQQVQMLVNNLQLPDEELQERSTKIQKAIRKLDRKLDSLDDDIDLSYSYLIRKGKYELEDEVDTACRNLDKYIDDLGRMSMGEDFAIKYRSTITTLVDRTLKRSIDRIAEEAKHKLKSCVREFCEETEDILLKYIEDFDVRDYIKKVSFLINHAIDGIDIWDSSGNEDEETPNTMANFFKEFRDILLAPFYAYCRIWNKIGNLIFGNGDIKRDLHQEVENARSSFNCELFIEGLISRKDYIINLVREKIMTDLLYPLQKQHDDILGNIKNKESDLASAIAHQKELEIKLCEFNDAMNRTFQG